MFSPRLLRELHDAVNWQDIAKTNTQKTHPEAWAKKTASARRPTSFDRDFASAVIINAHPHDIGGTNIQKLCNVEGTT